MEERMDERLAWRVYNFINAYKNGAFGFVRLQNALDKHFKDWECPPPLKSQIGNML